MSASLDLLVEELNKLEKLLTTTSLNEEEREKFLSRKQTLLEKLHSANHLMTESSNVLKG